MNTEKEFSKLYHSYAPKVFRLCLGYAGGDSELAKEWQQETFIKVWNHRKSFQAKSSMGTWIYKIAVNTCLGALRKDKKNNQINENSLPEVAQMEDDNHRELQLNKMFKCIDKLNTNNKAIILLELEDIPQATIAEVHGLTHGSLRTRLNRIRKSLLKCITNE